jgi:hypothetical protein
LAVPEKNAPRALIGAACELNGDPRWRRWYPRRDS